jgi:hypothetical protein
LTASARQETLSERSAELFCGRAEARSGEAAALASTPPEHAVKDVTAGGHLRLFLGHQALQEHWPALMTEVLRHSKPRNRRLARARA